MRHGPLISPRWSDPATGKFVPRSWGRPSTTEYRSVLSGKDTSEKNVSCAQPSIPCKCARLHGRSICQCKSVHIHIHEYSLLPAVRQWDWSIIVDLDTDEAGWQYGGLGFWELGTMRLAVRSRPRTWDLVKRRRWVHQAAREQTLMQDAVRAPAAVDIRE